MPDVNTMSFNQLATVLNAIHNQATGKSAAAAKEYLHKAQGMLLADPRFRLVQMYYDVDPL